VIPYFVIPPLRIGPIDVQPFGILAAAGIWLASALLLRGARRRGVDEAPLKDFPVWAVLAGVVGGHLVHLLFYHPEELRQGGVLQLLRVWDGLSSTGGVLGRDPRGRDLLSRAAPPVLALFGRLRAGGRAGVGGGAAGVLLGARPSRAPHLFRAGRGVS